MSADFIYLASGSPRRRALLAQIGVPFQVLGTVVDETNGPAEVAESYVTRVARAKAEAGWLARRLPAGPVLAADTVVVKNILQPVFFTAVGFGRSDGPDNFLPPPLN